MMGPASVPLEVDFPTEYKRKSSKHKEMAYSVIFKDRDGWRKELSWLAKINYEL